MATSGNTSCLFLKAGQAAEPVALIDLDHLARQTFRDPVLEKEVLGLFVDQARTMAERLSKADNAGRLALLHSLKGSAKAIGAFPLADHAARLETAAADPVDIAPLQALIAETIAAISQRIG